MHPGYKSIQFIFRVVILISAARKTNPYSVRNIPNALRPNKLVQICVNSYIICLHLLSSEFSDRFYGSRRSSLKSYPVYVLVDMDSKLTRNYVLLCSPPLGTFAFASHIYSNKCRYKQELSNILSRMLINIKTRQLSIVSTVTQYLY